MLGMHGTVYANYAINEADLLLALGVRFDDRVTGKVSEFAKHGKIVHIDIDPSEINKIKAATVPAVRRYRRGPRRAAGPDRGGFAARAARRGLIPAGCSRSTLAQGGADPLQDRDDAIVPQYAIAPALGDRARNAAARASTIVTTGVGQHQMWAAQYWHFDKPRS